MIASGGRRRGGGHGDRLVGPLGLGGVLDWQMLPVIAPTSLYSRILSYLPAPGPPQNGATVQRGQRLPGPLAGLGLTVVCNSRCTRTATATVSGRLARRLGLVSAHAESRSYVVGTGRLADGWGRRTLSITFPPRSRRALARSSSVGLAVAVRSVDSYSGQSATYRLSTTLNR